MSSLWPAELCHVACGAGRGEACHGNLGALSPVVSACWEQGVSDGCLTRVVAPMLHLDVAHEDPYSLELAHGACEFDILAQLLVEL